MEIKKVGVIGCGLMGSGIAQVCAEAGYDVVVREVKQKFLDKGLGNIGKILSRNVEKGKIREDRKNEILEKIKGTILLDDLKESDIIIEAAVEDLKVKQELFSTLHKLCRKDTIFASNTSSLCITDIASTSRADRFLGLHFFNPVPVMKLVEVVRTIATSDDTFNRAFNFAKSIGKVPIATKDNSGFIVNLLLLPYLLDAIRALEAGVGSVEDIDNGMKLGCGHPMGPFTLLDFVGIDTTYYIAEIMFKEYREKRYAPPPLLKRMVSMGYFGRKSGKGFYDYTKGDLPVVNIK